MICATEEDLGSNSNMQQKKETFKEQMDRQDFHTHCSYVRARRSPYLRQQIFAGGEHILHIPWRVCQGTALSWHAVPASEALREPSGREGVPGGCQLQACQESYPTSRGWDEHGWARGRADTQKHRIAPLSGASCLCSGAVGSCCAPSGM